MIFNIISLIIITIEKMAEDEKKDILIYIIITFTTKKEGSSRTFDVSYNQAFSNTLILFA